MARRDDSGRRVRRRAGPGRRLRSRGLALALCFEPYDLPVLLPVGVAGFTLAVHGVRVRRGLVARAAHRRWRSWSCTCFLDAVGRLRRLDAARRLEALFYGPAGRRLRGVSRLPRLAAVAAALWVAVEALAVGARSAGCPGAGSPSPRPTRPFGPRCPTSARTGVSLLVALVGTTARLGGADGAGVPAGRAVIVAALGLGAGRAARRSLAPYAAPTDGGASVAAVQGNVPGRRAWTPRERRASARQPRETTIELPPRRRGGRGAGARPRDLAGELHATSTRSATPRSTSEIREAVDADRRAVLVGAMVDGPAEQRSATRASSGTPRPGRRTVHQAAPGAVRRVHPVRDSSSLTRCFERLDQIPRDM